MPVKSKLGIIDTQDVILGNPMYDVASLIDDVRIQIPLTIKNKIFQYYLKKSSLRKDIYFLKNDFDILSIQRNLKILGIFYRLYKRDKKPQYLKYLPYTWKLIELRMKNKIFKNLEKILLEVVGKKLRRKRNFKWKLKKQLFLELVLEKECTQLQKKFQNHSWKSKTKLYLKIVLVF